MSGDETESAKESIQKLPKKAGFPLERSGGSPVVVIDGEVFDIRSISGPNFTQDLRESYSGASDHAMFFPVNQRTCFELEVNVKNYMAKTFLQRRLAKNRPSKVRIDFGRFYPDMIMDFEGRVDDVSVQEFRLGSGKVTWGHLRIDAKGHVKYGQEARESGMA